MEMSPFLWLVFLVPVFAVVLGAPWFCYWQGKKVGEQSGYLRGYKDGLQRGPQANEQKPRIDVEAGVV
jgi:hypothetical protein